jgi:hypothetical protein
MTTIDVIKKMIELSEKRKFGEIEKLKRKSIERIRKLILDCARYNIIINGVEQINWKVNDKEEEFDKLKEDCEMIEAMKEVVQSLPKPFKEKRQ